MTYDHIVEIGVLEHATQAVYSTVVCPPVFSSGDVEPVHGISDEELKQGPDFKSAFRRMTSFLENIIVMAVQDMSDSSDDDFGAQPALKEQPPQIVIVAHNGLLGYILLLNIAVVCCCSPMFPHVQLYQVQT